MLDEPATSFSVAISTGLLPALVFFCLVVVVPFLFFADATFLDFTFGPTKMLEAAV